MRAHLDETPYAVLLSATEGYKTLKVHSPSLVVPDWEYLRSHGEQWEQEYPTVSSILNIESTFTCIELRIGREAYRSYNRSIPTFPLDILKSGCPMISKMNIELDEFRGYSMGWDWYSCEAAKVPWPMRTPMKSAYNDVAISRIARFANLQYLTTHFFISTVVVGVMGPRQKRQAAFDFYKSIEKQKCGVRLDRLDVVFYIGEHFDWKNYAVKDVEPLVTVTVCPLEKPKGHCRYRVTCEDTRSEEVLCRTTKTLGLGGLVLPFGCPCPTLECNHSTISSLRKALVNTSAKTLLSPFGLRRSENEEAVWPFDVDTLEYE